LTEGWTQTIGGLREHPWQLPNLGQADADKDLGQPIRDLFQVGVRAVRIARARRANDGCRRCAAGSRRFADFGVDLSRPRNPEEETE
jgi:hypothetical protein